MDDDELLGVAVLVVQPAIANNKIITAAGSMNLWFIFLKMDILSPLSSISC